MWPVTKWVILWSLWAARLVTQPGPVVTAGGRLVGSVAPDGSHVRYYGVPYASAPDRFKDSKPLPQWEGVFKAYDEHIRCTQRFSSTRILGQEDCLRLNVYTPLQTNDHLLPVMVFIHGGGFRDGSASPFLYGPEYLVQHGVILVTFNYRLEILGFLCLGTEDAPGNVGIKDQVQAMRWVQKNIEAFGGNPDDVTIFGESAGSASVMYHLMSPMSKGLFHKAIMQSGAATSPWSVQFEPLKTATLLAKQINHKTENPKHIYKIFMNMTAEKLLSSRVPRNDGDIVLSENIFVPCVDKKIDGIEQFLPDSPYNLLASGNYNKVPIIIGYNNAEGYMFAGKENDTTVSKMDLYKALPRDLVFPSEKDKVITAKTLQQYYMGDKTISKETLFEFSSYEGDCSIIFPIVSSIDLLSKTSSMPVYAYRFCYDGWMNLAKMLFGFGKYPGATHADELFYLFNIQVVLPNTFLETNFVRKFTTLWANFAKFGDPTPSSTDLVRWKPASAQNPQVLELSTHYTLKDLWDSEILLYWNTTYSKYRRKS